MTELHDVLADNGWFQEPGQYVLFDGQFGSTGKGLLASAIAEVAGHYIDTVATNAGPNSGHTGYFHGEKILTQQLPVASCVMTRRNINHLVYLNGGAVIEPSILLREMDFNRTLLAIPETVVHPAAAIIRPEHQGDQLSHIASTGKGVGPAMAAKLGRTKDAVVGDYNDFTAEIHERATIASLSPTTLGTCFVETAQGWSLGINSGFYPYTTSRECSVSQALADLGVSPKSLKKSIACLRTYPIRVGNTPDGYSGDVYPDQVETTWEALGQTPEKTTVTQRVRRVFTWSNTQFRDMLIANRPDAIMINFANYMQRSDVMDLVARCRAEQIARFGSDFDFVLLGWGPYNDQIEVLR